MKNAVKEYAPKGNPVKVNDHDFEGPGGKACPYGVYDLNFNEGFVNVGLSTETAEFAVNGIRERWQTMGAERYPESQCLCITADGGGSCRRSVSLSIFCSLELSIRFENQVLPQIFIITSKLPLYLR